MCGAPVVVLVRVGRWCRYNSCAVFSTWLWPPQQTSSPCSKATTTPTTPATRVGKPLPSASPSSTHGAHRRSQHCSIATTTSATAGRTCSSTLLCGVSNTRHVSTGVRESKRGRCHGGAASSSSSATIAQSQRHSRGTTHFSNTLSTTEAIEIVSPCHDRAVEGGEQAVSWCHTLLSCC